MHSEKLEPEIYASPGERLTQNQSDAIKISVGKATQADPPNDLSEVNLNALLRGVASPSLNEIDRVIHDLENVREILCKEGERDRPRDHRLRQPEPRVDECDEGDLQSAPNEWKDALRAHYTANS